MKAGDSSAGAGGSGFSARVMLALLAVGVFATVAFLVLSTYAPDLRARQGGGGNALSTSAIGYAGVVRLLRMIDEPVVVNETRNGVSAYPGLMVLTPMQPGVVTVAGGDNDRLIVLPKWAAGADQTHPGWQADAQLIPEAFAVAVLPKGVRGVTLVRRPASGAGPGRLISELGVWPDAGLPVGPVASFQTLQGGNLQPIVKDEQGRAVLTVAPGGHLYVLSDPDLLDTQGIKDPRTARIAATLLLALRAPDQAIAFDVSLDGLGGQRSLLRLALEPPFLASTLCLLVVAALVGVQAWFRFGPATQRGRAVALGKTALVENGASMVRLARRDPRMAARYVQLCRERASAALGATHLDGAALDDFLDRWAARVGAADRISALAEEARSVKDATALTALAQRTRQWRQEVTRGS